MKTVIIYAHPYEKSFNHAVLLKVEELLKKEGKEVDVFDLNADNFDPVMRKEDLALFGKGEYADKLAESYAHRLKEADELVMVFPIWWYGEPAILKGFHDKVFLKGQTYTEKDHQLVGLLNIKKATILTTASIDKNVLNYLGNPVENVLAKGILGMVGIKDVSWIHCPSFYIEESRTKYLKEIEEHFSK
ncbi:MAG: NAD(P)H-dependent oxidoreductase [Erysipelotrichaceae bacterium]|jgi:putative NADPH-quinone reductase|nr:NAD(P)H-dependent oxidoreductase [Erysipelotrichaceae bacterium]